MTTRPPPSKSSKTVLKNMRLVCERCILHDMAVVMDDGVIEQVVEYDDSLFIECNVVDLNGALLCPGFIDLQIYGSGGNLFGGHPTVEGLRQLESDLCAQGTTGFLATIATNTYDIIKQGMVSAIDIMHGEKSKGNFLGLHLEGPFISSHRRGAHPEVFIETCHMAIVRTLLEDAQGTLKMMTIAAELVSADIREVLQGHGVVLSCGHSNATFSEASSFLRRDTVGPCPADHDPSLVPTVTHLFNAMPPLHHRDLGLVGAVLEHKPFASIIVDGLHVDFAMVRLAKKLMQGKLFLITDAVTDSTQGTYPHIRQEDEVVDANGISRIVAKYVMPDGTLSGSALTMPLAVRNCVEYCGISLPEAVNMASLYPARVIGMDGRKGKIQSGADADLCIIDDKFNVLATFIGGKCVYNKDNFIQFPP